MAANLTPARAAILRRLRDEQVYVYRDPARVGGGFTRATLDRLRDAGLVATGEYEPLRGKRVTLADLGCELLAACDDRQAGVR